MMIIIMIQQKIAPVIIVTVSCRRVILGKLIVTQLIKKPLALCRTKIEGL
jgi:hypothetical protein